MAYDNLLIIRDGSTNLTATETIPAAGFNIPFTPLRGLDLNIVVPSVSGTGPTLAVSLQEAATSGGTYNTFRQYPVNITAAGEYNMRFHLDKTYQFIKVVLTVGGTTPNFGGTIVRVGMDEGSSRG